MKERDGTLYIVPEKGTEEALRNLSFMVWNLYELNRYYKEIEKDIFRRRIVPVLATVCRAFRFIGIYGETPLAGKAWHCCAGHGGKEGGQVAVISRQMGRYTGNCFCFREEMPLEVILDFHIKEIAMVSRPSGEKRFVIGMSNIFLGRGGEKRGVNDDIINFIIPFLKKNDVSVIAISALEQGRLHPRGISRETLKKVMQRNYEKRIVNPDTMFLTLAKNMELAEELARVVFVGRKGFSEIKDQKGNYVNYIQNERYTVGNPEKSSRTIFLFGPCIMCGAYVADKDTIASHLRSRIPGDYYIKNMGQVFYNINVTMRLQRYRPGDIVVFMVNDNKAYARSPVEIFDLTEVYNRIPGIEKHVFDDLFHADGVVTRYIADALYKYMEKNNVFREKEAGTVADRGAGLGRTGISYRNPAEEGLKKYLDNIKPYRTETSGKIGAIVMNCNPFTKGHLYLTESASSQVDHLYIFVVEEDKSQFPFCDRIRLIREGTRHLPNVTVLPSGKYMASFSTLPGYFERENWETVELDASLDLGNFSAYIAPTLGIRFRFAGEEPIDHYTMQYNREMRRILPEYGISFIEIKRKEIGGAPVSASDVRRCLKQGNWKKIRELVPECTWKYLLEKEGKQYEKDSHVRDGEAL